tara:strand:- start:211369 stop:212418 length:1050 start_codon:yes stop_codon:yes gene_type:complete
MSIKLTLLTTAALLAYSNASFAAGQAHNHAEMLKNQKQTAHAHNAYEPLNVIGTHTHGKNEWMLSYSYMHMEMSGIRKGTDGASVNDVYASSYMSAPLSMKTDMHMLGGMYGINNDFTFMAMVPYVEKSMDMRTQAGVKFTTKSSGFGDVKVSIIDSLARYNLSKWSATYSLSLPTGSIDKSDSTPTASNIRLGYPMQLGSGTFDFTPTLTYADSCGCHNNIHFGAQAYGTFRINDNSKNYRLGNRFGLKTWLGKTFSEEVSAGITLDAVHESEISGKDSSWNAMMAPGTNTTNSGYEKATAGFDISYKPKSVKRLKLSAGYTAPIYQDVNGYQTDSDHMFTLNVRKAF